MAGSFSSFEDINNVSKFSKIVHQFGGAKSKIKVRTQSDLMVKLIPTKRRLMQNDNTRIIIRNIENVPDKSPLKENIIVIVRPRDDG